MFTELNNNIKNFLYQKYKILYHTNFLNFDENYDLLYHDLLKVKKESFKENEKIIIEQFDTDFYDSSLLCGLHNRNVVECLRAADIPFFSVIFITNNYNFDHELKLLINEQNEGFPIILKTISSKKTISSSYINKEINFNFKKTCLCLLDGTKRSHRLSLYNFFKSKKFFDKIAVSYNNE